MRDTQDWRKSSGASVQLLAFINFLRDAEYSSTSADAALISRALDGFSAPDPELSRSSCRAICCRSQDQWQRFDQLFNQFWFDSEERTDNDITSGEVDGRNRQKGGLVGISGSAEVFGDLDDSDQGTAMGAGRQTTVSKADFRFLGDKTAMRRVESLAEQIARRVRSRRSRRTMVTTKPGQIALGPTLRASIRSGGVPLRPLFIGRRLEPPRLVVLHDVSHSMTFNNPMLIRFTRGLVRYFKNAHAYVFHTRLFPVTEILREASITRMREKLEDNNRLWLGGTCIADSLEEYLQNHSGQTLGWDSVVLIVSDGFDANEPEGLAQALMKLKRRSRRVIWLNPMLQRQGFNPEKEEVWNVKRNVDYLLPAHSLKSLELCVAAIAGHTITRPGIVR